MTYHGAASVEDCLHRWAYSMAGSRDDAGLVADAVAGQAGRFDVFARLQHHRFPGGPLLRTPAQGADTVLWLASREPGETGLLWEDRTPVPW